MRKLLTSILAIFSIFVWFSFAITTSLDPSFNWDNTDSTTHYAANDNETSTENKSEITRTVITAVPKTGPSINIIWIILATLAIFGGYIYIKKRADI